MSSEHKITAPGLAKSGRDDAGSRRFIKILIVGVILNIAFFGGPLFLLAGTFDWVRAWIFLGVLTVGAIATMVLVFRDREDLLNERLKPPVQEGQPFADKILVLMLIAAFFGLIGFIPLDVFQFHLLGKPGTLVSSLGLALFIAGWWIISLVFKENAFAAPVVKYQEERRQSVVDTGPYSIVRHPMYAGAALLMIGMPLWLESYAAALLALLPIGILALRILVEEKFLRRELQGYDAYTKKVQFRLIPFIW
jgi:protein-S-isoprenylcysteine O-methyltransferase Ste14